ncbi:MAG: presqualene diphosphate synthase HpnD [Alphaproteobacteria bacterium]|nr:presqualene diphosphate synthase HpnD [Alphaproteobacteria bacterium]
MTNDAPQPSPDALPISEAMISPLLYAKDAEAVLDIVKNSGSSFLLGMMALPHERRMGMFGLYAFCRVVDDIADSELPAPERLTMLQEWRVHTANLFKGQASHPVMELLIDPVKEFQLVEKDFLSIIDGMEMDAQQVIFAPTWDELDTYCDCVASAVGRVSVRIFGEPTENGSEVAYHLGRALQLTNILRDIDEDALRGRLYMPLEALEEAGISIDNHAMILQHASLDHACRAVARRAVEHFGAADEAMEKCERKAMKPARLMRDYYEKILRVLLEIGWDYPRPRVSLTAFEKIGMFIKSWF